MKRVLLTGARGFIGRHAAGPLRARGFDVHGVTSRAASDESADVHWHRADLLAPGTARALPAEIGATHLLHFAWFAEPGTFWTSPENERWRAASLELLEGFAAAGGGRAVVAGSCAEYEWGGDERCSETATPLRPATAYGGSKLALWRSAATLEQLSLGWGRIFFVFGPGEHPQRLVSSVARALLRGEPAETSTGEQVRDFIYAPELADAFAAFLESDVSGPVNVASGRDVTVRSLVERVGEAVGRPDLLRIGARPSPAGEPPRLVADTTRLTREVGWDAALELDDAIERTVAWWREREAGDRAHSPQR